MKKNIPTFDLRTIVGRTHAELVSKIRYAAENVGFFAVSHTGVQKIVVKRAFEQAKSFFNAPYHHKENWRYQCTDLNHGWVCVGQESLDPTKPADLKESFTMRNVGLTIHFADLWPDSNFRDECFALYENAQLLSQSLLMLLAEGLQLPANWFLGSHTGENQTLRLLHYPRIVDPISEGQMGAGVHTDYGSITLLWQDAVGGLEVLDRGGNWLTLEPQEDVVLVNIGDLMQRWTNDVLFSTLHRVQRRSSDCDRYSIAFFCDPDDSAEISIAPTCIAQGDSPHYPSILAGDYIRAKLKATY